MDEKLIGMSVEKAKRLGKGLRRTPCVSKEERERIRGQEREERRKFVARQKRKMQKLLRRGIDPDKRVHIVTKDGRVLFLMRLNPQTGVATCRTTRNVAGVKFDDIARLATPEEIPRLSKQL